MAALTWRNVDAPDFRGALEGYQQFSQLLGNAFGGAQKALESFDNTQIDINSRNAIASLLTEYQGSPDKLEADLASGAFTGRFDPRRLNDKALSVLAERPKQLLDYADTKGDVADETLLRSRRDKVFGDKEAARADVTAFINKALTGDEDGARAILAGSSTIKNLPIEDILGLATDGQGLVKGDVDIDGGRLDNIGKDQDIRFGAENQGWSRQDRNEGRAATVIAQMAIEGAGGDPDLVRSNFFGISKGLDPVVRSQAARILAGQFGDVFGPTSIVSDAVAGDGLYGVGGWQITDRPGSARPGGRKHAGFDLSGMSVGTPVFAPMDGKVTAVKPNNGNAGNMVTVQYADGKTNTFMHLDEIGVKPGQTFKAGTPIATAGNTGNASTRGTDKAVLHVEGTAGLVRAKAIQAQIESDELGAAGINGQDILDGLGDNSKRGDVVAALKKKPEFKGVADSYIANRISEIQQNTRKKDGTGGATPAQAAAILRNSMTGADSGLSEFFRFGDNPNLPSGWRIKEKDLQANIEDFRNNKTKLAVDRDGVQVQIQQIGALQKAVQQEQAKLSNLLKRKSEGAPIPAAALLASEQRLRALSNELRSLSRLKPAPLGGDENIDSKAPTKRDAPYDFVGNATQMVNDILSGNIFSTRREKK
jgi:hypothetical protein